MIMIQMLHVNIFIIIGSLCAGLCDIAAALINLYYVLESTRRVHFLFSVSLSLFLCFFFSIVFFWNVIDRSNGGVCRLRSLSISSFFSFSSFTVNYLHNCLAKSLLNTLHLFTEGKEKRKHFFTCCFCFGFLSSAAYRHTHLGLS
jgi:hypothetical protein